MLDITNLMNDLACDRPVFHSEADFQHALAWCIHDAIPDGEVRLEFKPFPVSAEQIYLDIWLPGIGVAVELKYKTRELHLRRDGEYFALRDHSAVDISRYDFLKDIQRLEQLRQLRNARVGFAILLTNNHSFWTPPPPSRPTTIDAAFRLHEGRTITGEMAWCERAGAGTTKNREAPIRLSGSYDLHWQDYADMGDGRNRRFRYLAVQTAGAPPALSGPRPRRT